MRTKDYIVKYNLDRTDKFNHYKFTRDLSVDFNEICIKNQAYVNDARFVQSVKQIRNKYESIVKKTRGNIDEKVWKYFYASVVCRKREELHNQDTVINNVIRFMD